MIQKYQLNGPIQPMGYPELVNPRFYRGTVTYDPFNNRAIIQVIYEVDSVQGLLLFERTYYQVECTDEWGSADAEAAMLSLEEHKNASLI